MSGNIWLNEKLKLNLIEVCAVVDNVTYGCSVVVNVFIDQEPVVILCTHRVPSKHPYIFDIIVVI